MLFSNFLVGQNSINTDILFSASYQSELDSSKKVKFITEIGKFFSEIEDDNLNDKKIFNQNHALSISVFSSLKDMAKEKRTDAVTVYKMTLIDLYKIGDDKYMASISYVKHADNEAPVLKLIFNFIIVDSKNVMQFDIPINYMTRYWKKQKVDLTTYVFRNEINLERAILFNKKNREIAGKMNQSPENFMFYMTENYKELNEFMGFAYEADNAGRVRDGYGVDANTIFAVQNNEDFSHDIFHYYSGKVNKRIDRNWVTEEGIAYLWGNAYYTDAKGDMIDQELLVMELKKYLEQYPDVSLLELFEKNPGIFTHLAKEVKVRSVISGVICEAVEKQWGMEGINKLINAGAKNRVQKYKMIIDELLSINDENFDVELKKLLDKKNAPSE